MAERRQDALALAGDAGAPVDQRAEHVEEEGFYVLGHAASLGECGRPCKRQRQPS